MRKIARQSAMTLFGERQMSISSISRNVLASSSGRQTAFEPDASAFRLISSRSLLFCVSFLIVAVAATVAVGGDEPAPKVSPAVMIATKHAASLEVEFIEKNATDELKLCERPLLTFGDPARGNEAGTLWAWSTGGRPVAMMELYRATGDDQPWIHALTMTSTPLMRLTNKAGVVWTPKKHDFQLREVSDEVGNKPVLRLRQMKDLARRFAAHEFWDPNNSRFELRLLAQPVHRYSDAANKLLDGAVFVFAHGTNPEVLLFLEAAGGDASSAKWQYACFRLGSAELHVALDDREVWMRERTPGVVGTPNDPYWLLIGQKNEE